MSSDEGKIPVQLISEVVGKWRKTYHWIPIFSAVVAFAMAFFTGANNIPIPFSTVVGSGTLTLIQATVAAFVIYVPGAAFASNSTLDELLSDFLKEKQPNEGFLMWSLVAVLITAAIWLALATYFELPVSSQQATQGALLGTMLVTEGFGSLLHGTRDSSSRGTTITLAACKIVSPRGCSKSTDNIDRLKSSYI